MQTTLYNDWYVRTDDRIGPWNITDSQLPTSEQIHNATKIYNYLSGLGWSLSAIAGILGNMQHESTLDPALIQASNRWRLPNSAANLSDVPNSVMLNFYKEYYNVQTRAFGIGLVQWDGYTSTPPAGQKLVSLAERYSMIWFDGDTQLFRLRREKEENIQWTTYTFYGITWTWNNYVTNNRTPEQSARIWMSCYEVAEAGLEARQKNARYWYDYFSGGPEPPEPPEPPGPEPPEPPMPSDWIGGDEFARLALSYNGQYLPYSDYDCIGYVNLVWRDIPVVQANNWNLTNGTNSLWRSIRTFNTTDPQGTTPTTELWWKGTIDDCDYQWTGIPVGCLLFRQIPEEGPPAIPPQYAGDGIGNFVHVGIYVGNDKVMQSGGADAASVPGGGVHLSDVDWNWWTHVAFVVWVDTVNYYPPPTYYFPTWLKMWYTTQRKKVLKNVKRSI